MLNYYIHVVGDREFWKNQHPSPYGRPDKFIPVNIHYMESITEMAVVKKREMFFSVIDMPVEHIYARRLTEEVGTGRDIYKEAIPSIKPGDELIEFVFNYIPPQYPPLTEIEGLYEIGLGGMVYEFRVDIDGRIFVKCPWEGCEWEEFTGSITYPIYNWVEGEEFDWWMAYYDGGYEPVMEYGIMRSVLIAPSGRGWFERESTPFPAKYPFKLEEESLFNEVEYDFWLDANNCRRISAFVPEGGDVVYFSAEAGDGIDVRLDGDSIINGNEKRVSVRDRYAEGELCIYYPEELTTSVIKVYAELKTPDGSSYTPPVIDYMELRLMRNSAVKRLDDVINGKAFLFYSNDESDAVKELENVLNQVMPRKRGISYNFISENGIYGDRMTEAIQKFDKEFDNLYGVNYGVDNEVIDYFRNEYGVEIEDGKVVDAGILVGRWYEKNYASAGTSAVDGLWELYANVVVPFIEEMIEEGKRYVNAEGSDYPGANTYWTARTGERVTVGVSYCYGCKDTVEDFKKYVTRCPPPAVGKPPSGVKEENWKEYRGKVNDVTCSHLGGEKGYPGLSKEELNTASKDQPYWPTYWAGIDCSGFVQRVVLVSQKKIGGEIVKTRFKELEWSHAPKDVIRNAMWSGAFIEEQYSYYIQTPDIGNFKRGDFVVYDSDNNGIIDHISLIYCTPDDDPEGECAGLTTGQYKIIHAFGTSKADIDNDRATPMVFTRKVVITPNQMETSIGPFPSPLGFGRIKLWD